MTDIAVVFLDDLRDIIENVTNTADKAAFFQKIRQQPRIEVVSVVYFCCIAGRWSGGCPVLRSKFRIKKIITRCSIGIQSFAT